MLGLQTHKPDNPNLAINIMRFCDKLVSVLPHPYAIVMVWSAPSSHDWLESKPLVLLLKQWFSIHSFGIFPGHMLSNVVTILSTWPSLFRASFLFGAILGVSYF